MRGVLSCALVGIPPVTGMKAPSYQILNWSSFLREKEQYEMEQGKNHFVVSLLEKVRIVESMFSLAMIVLISANVGQW